MMLRYDHGDDPWDLAVFVEYPLYPTVAPGRGPPHMNHLLTSWIIREKVLYGVASPHSQAICWVRPYGMSGKRPEATDIATDIKWIGLRENLQETIDFPIKYGFSCKISLKPIHWWYAPWFLVIIVLTQWSLPSGSQLHPVFSLLHGWQAIQLENFHSEQKPPFGSRVFMIFQLAMFY